jgi:hypothetical protein
MADSHDIKLFGCWTFPMVGRIVAMPVLGHPPLDKHLLSEKDWMQSGWRFFPDRLWRRLW